MSDDIDLGKLTDRELLVLVVQGFNSHGKRLDSHAADIKDLRAWRMYLSGALGAVVVWAKHWRAQ